MSQATRSKSLLLRHFYTCAEVGTLGGPGFQTVAYCQRLGPIVENLERLVEGYSPPELAGPSCLQLMPVPGYPQYYALTVFTPTGPCPDGREGNYWAETLVVEAGWLERAGWDAEAAFQALPWQGPREPAQLTRELPLEEPPPLAPGPLERLARLREAVPQGLLAPLVLALAQQSRGLQPLRLVERSGADPGELAEAVLLLPLLVPPACRTYPAGEHRRCLSLRTRSPRAGMPSAADITGWPAEAADQAEATGSLVIDLGGGLPAPGGRERFGKDYAGWLAQALEEGAWERITGLYRRAGEIPGAAFFDRFRELLPRAGAVEAAARPKVSARVEPPATEAAESGAETAGTSPWQARRQAWAAREEAEGAIWQLLEQHRAQLQELVGSSREQLAASSKSAEAQLWQTLDEHQAQIERSREEAVRLLARRGEELEAELSDSTARLAKEKKNLARQHRDLEDKIKRLDKRISRLQKELRGLSKAGPAAGGVEEEGETPEETAGESPWTESLRERLSGWLRHPAVGWGGALLVLLVILVGAYRLWPRSPGGELPAASAGAVQDPSAEQRRAALVERLQQGEVAVELLEQAAAREELAERSHALTLALHLQREGPLPENLRCVLLQAALHRRALTRDEAPLTVDGQCGPGTRNALAAAARGTCCTRFTPGGEQDSPVRLQGCFVARELELPETESCTGASPWRGNHTWNGDEAARGLALVRHAFDAVGGDRAEELAPALARLDAGKSPALRQELAGATLTAEEARHLLDLAFALVTVDAGARAPDSLSADHLEGIETLLGLPSGAGESGSETAAGTRGTSAGGES